MKGGRTLHIGVDDSNHAGRIPGEIFVATFSFDSRYGLSEEGLGNSRSGVSDMEQFVKEGGDYRFTIRTPDQFNHSRDNAAIVGSTLISKYFFEMGLDGKIDECFVYVDGSLCPENRKALKYDLDHLQSPEVVIRDLPKKWMGCISRWRHGSEKVKYDKNHMKKGYRSPLVWLADGIAHNILRDYQVKGLEEMEKSPRCYPEKAKLKKGCWVIFN
jgi:hypothetical protein